MVSMVGAGTLCWRASRATAPWMVSISVRRLRMMSSRIDDFDAGAAAGGVDQLHQHRTRLRDIERDALGLRDRRRLVDRAEHDLLQLRDAHDLDRAQVRHRRNRAERHIAEQLLPFLALDLGVAFTGRPCAVKALAIATVRSERPPAISPM